MDSALRREGVVAGGYGAGIADLAVASVDADFASAAVAHDLRGAPGCFLLRLRVGTRAGRPGLFHVPAAAFAWNHVSGVRPLPGCHFVVSCLRKLRKVHPHAKAKPRVGYRWVTDTPSRRWCYRRGLPARAAKRFQTVGFGSNPGSWSGASWIIGRAPDTTRHRESTTFRRRCGYSDRDRRASVDNFVNTQFSGLDARITQV